jgi:hypothetical protein
MEFLAVPFLTAHESASGTSRHFAALPDLVAIGAWRTSINRINQVGAE